VAKKVLQLVFVLFAVSFLSFLLLDLLPGDAALAKCGLGCDESALEQVREDNNLNDPLPVQYFTWLGNVVSGDLGASQVDNQPVSEALSQRLPVTLELVVYAQFLALALAIPVGLLTAWRAGGAFDRISGIGAGLAISVPNYVWSFIFITVFAVGLGWFPPSNYTGLENLMPDVGAQATNLWENLRSLFLPAFSLALAEWAVYSRLLRNDLIATMQEDYITMARAKGLPARYIMRKHAFRPSTFSLVTIAGINMARLVGGTIIIESIFNVNGIGLYVATAIAKRDPYPLQGAVLVIATATVVINFGVDLLYAAIDPRIRHVRSNA
jgi:peptide/nickel transport system permease protein